MVRKAGKGVMGSPLWMKTMKNLFLEEANGKNLVYSPLSIYVALGLLTNGSKGETRNQLLGFLKSQNLDGLNGFCSQLMNSLNETQTCNSALEKPPLSLVNSVWVEQSCGLIPKFQEAANSIFRAQVEDVDFRNKADDVIVMINQWVEKNTNGIIKNLVSSLSRDTKVVLVNALHFKGFWHKGQFDKSLTNNSEFYLLDRRSSVKVPFMTSKEVFQYISCRNGCKVLKLPYKLQTQTANGSHSFDDEFDESARRFSMYIILPDRRYGLGELIDKANSDSTSFLDQYVPEYVSLRLIGKFKVPKFKITFDFDAKKVLEELGLVLPLSPEAELTEMVDSFGSISQVIHKCFVEVDEEGTEGAAATAMEFWEDCDGGPPPRPPPVEDFVADHPFMFIIKDEITGVLLFTGYVLNPLLDS